MKILDIGLNKYCCYYYYYTRDRKTLSNAVTFVLVKLDTNLKCRIFRNNVCSSASAMFVTNNIPNFEAFLRKSIYSFTTRISFSSNNLICAIEQSWVMKTVWKMWEEK